MSNELTTVTADTMIQSAIEKGITPDGLEKLVAMRLKIMAVDAEAAFNRAMQEFQSECPPVGKNRTVKTGKYSYSYAELDHIAETIRPLLAKHGLSYSFDSSVTDTGINAICTVRHLGGHSRASSFSAPIDGTAVMNDMQKAASALSYARRYALILALGLTTGERDDDGAAAGLVKITDKQAADLQSLIDEVDADPVKFCKFMGVEALDDIPAQNYDKAVRALEAKRGKAA